MQQRKEKEWKKTNAHTHTIKEGVRRAELIGYET